VGGGERRAHGVSTNTINLQEQLVGKDLPFLERRCPTSACASRCSGVTQLPCLVRLDQRAAGNALFDEGLNDELGRPRLVRNGRATDR
jgi:ATP-dependent DNA helicase DinG